MGSARRDRVATLAQSYPISLIVPVHNGAEALLKCLEAIRANDCRDVEVIVVDDGSTDDCAILLTKVSRSWPQLRVVSRPESGGPAAARNSGREVASHPYHFFIDADIVVGPRTVQWVRESLDLYSHRPEVVGVLGAYSEEIPDRGFWGQYKNLYTTYLYRTTDTITPFVHTPVFCIRAQALEELGGFDVALRRGEDFRLGLRLAAEGKRVVIDWRITAVHLKHYTLATLLAEDWQRVIQLCNLTLTPEERRLSRKAHRPGRLLALLLPLPTVAVAVGSLWWPVAGVVALAMLVLFGLVQFRFLGYLWKRRGWLFGLRAAGFNWFEMGWAQLAVAASLLVRDRIPNPESRIRNSKSGRSQKPESSN